MNKLYNVDQIAAQLNISVKAVRNKIYKIGLKKVKTKDKRALYNENQIESLSMDNCKYYPLKTTVIYYIYESKMNKL
jgi:DNA-binding NarL/FixJ family response regulator